MGGVGRALWEHLRSHWGGAGPFHFLLISKHNVVLGTRGRGACSWRACVQEVLRASWFLSADPPFPACQVSHFSSALEMGETSTHLQREEELPKVLRAPSLLESTRFQKHPPLEEHRIPKPTDSSFVKVFSAHQNPGKKAPWLDCELNFCGPIL